MPRSKKRSHGEGSIYQSDGVWYAAISLPNGDRRKRRAASQKEAREKLRELQNLAQAGAALGKRQPTVYEWCTTWLDEFAPDLKPNIREDYRGALRRYLEKTALGKRRLDAVTPAMVQSWVNDTAKTVSPQTARNVYARVRRALQVAVQQGYLVRNVAATVELPSFRSRAIISLTFDQARALLAAVAGHRWAALYRLAVNLGLRQGELLGLTWGAVDLHHGTITICRQLQRIPENVPAGAKPRQQFVLQTTKTKAGERVIQLDDDLADVVAQHRANQSEERLLLGRRWRDPFTDQGGLLFTSETGGPIHQSNLTAHFHQALAAAGLPRVRFHDLRHTAATLLLADNVPIATVSKILGHSSVAVTASTYAHALDAQKAAAVAGLSAKLRRA